MLQAEIKGKFYSSSEDVLTSSVIGSMRYLSSPSFFVELVNNSFNRHGEGVHVDKKIKKITYLFWERLENSEPDVLVMLENEDATYHIICIEAKFLSGKSSKEDETVDLMERKNLQRDQLARELEDLHSTNFYKYVSIPPSKVNDISLIYLTNDTSMPHVELLDSSVHVRLPDAEKKIFWLSWSMIYSAVCEWIEYGTMQDQCILYDLKLLLEKKGLNNFSGLSGLEEVSKNCWVYSKASSQYRWGGLSEVVCDAWKYTQRGK
ncbi:hypothetical protein [Bacillus mobilis]|uniref:hypothetical protein n=1 Tax=Bacillus mobilis TaxID=2026190 RepID=UPI003CF9073A